MAGQVVRVLVDTHVLLWWLLGDSRLTPARRDELAREETQVLVSAASGWEIATKFRIGKLPVPDRLVRDLPNPDDYKVPSPDFTVRLLPDLDPGAGDAVGNEISSEQFNICHTHPTIASALGHCTESSLDALDFDDSARFSLDFTAGDVSLDVNELFPGNGGVTQIRTETRFFRFWTLD